MITIVVLTENLIKGIKLVKIKKRRVLGSIHGASLVAQLVKNLPATQETMILSLGQEDLLEKG